MSGNELMNESMEGAIEVSEVTTSNTIAKVAVAGVIVAAGVAVVLYIRKKRKANAENPEVEVQKVKATDKTQK